MVDSCSHGVAWREFGLAIMSVATLLIIVLIVVLVLGLPQIGMSPNYNVSGIVGVLLVVLLVLLLLGKI